MMETNEERKWHLIRNDNGEWISDDNAVFLSKVDARHLQIMSKLAGKKVSVQHIYDGGLWCYKHEINRIHKL